MRLLSLFLKNFRLYEESFFEFDAGVNIIYGANACGKTSLLEAIYLLITGRSFRGAQTEELIKVGSLAFFLEARFIKNELEQNLKIFCSPTEKRLTYNSTVYPSSAALMGTLKGIVLSPDDAGLIKGAPALRRRYLDMQIAQINPLYVHYLSRYMKAMKQRNQLLRLKQTEAITCWENEMAVAAAYITAQRLVAVKELQVSCQHLHRILTQEKTAFTLTYKTTAPLLAQEEMLQQYYLKQYARLRPRELQFGITLVGPHKDDLGIEIEQREARYFASEGQQRSGAATLRLAEWERVKEQGEETPLLLIDDMGMGLDEHRKKRLLSHIEKMGQVFLTTTMAHSLKGHMIAI